jgi:hypothetical protein
VTTYPYFETDDCLHLSVRQVICPQWPIRIEGMQGLWRYIQPIGDYDSGWAHFEAIGPYFPSNPSRNGGRSRIFRVDKAKYPGKRFKPVDVADLEARAISQDAQRARRR